MAAPPVNAKKKKQQRMLIIGAAGAALLLLLYLRSRSSSTTTTGQTAADQALAAQQAAQSAGGGGVTPSTFADNGASMAQFGSDVTNALQGVSTALTALQAQQGGGSGGSGGGSGGDTGGTAPGPALTINVNGQPAASPNKNSGNKHKQTQRPSVPTGGKTTSNPSTGARTGKTGSSSHKGPRTVNVHQNPVGKTAQTRRLQKPPRPVNIRKHH